MIAFLSLAASAVTSPVGRWVAALVGALIVVAAIYLAGASNTHNQDQVANVAAAARSERAVDQAGVHYDADGVTVRLRQHDF